MFTSRAEHRLLLREDNADLRLTEIGHKLGLVDENRWRLFSEKQEKIEKELQRLRDTCIHPSVISEKETEDVFGGKLSREYHMDELLRRPNVTYKSLTSIESAGPAVSDEAIAEQVEVQIKYAGYIERQQQEVNRQQRQENTALPDELDYSNVSGLSNEVRQKFIDQRPTTIGQASRIPGITPAAISILLVHLKKNQYQHKASA